MQILIDAGIKVMLVIGATGRLKPSGWRWLLLHKCITTHECYIGLLRKIINMRLGMISDSKDPQVDPSTFATWNATR